MTAASMREVSLDAIRNQPKSQGMRARLAVLLAAVLLATSPLVIVPMVGCSTSQQRQTINTLGSVGHATDAAVKTYLDLVVAGKVKTNDVPSVMARYSEFQSAFNIALIAATLNTNAPPDPSTVAASENVKSAIAVAKTR